VVRLSLMPTHQALKQCICRFCHFCISQSYTNRPRCWFPSSL
jgi:hypothetical protein